MAKVPLFGIGLQGKSAVVTAKALQNFFIEYRPEGEGQRVIGHGFPGLDLFVELGDTKWRGPCIEVPQVSLLYGVHRGVFEEVNNAGVVTERGMLNTVSGPIYMAHDGSRVVVVDGTNGYRYDIASTTLVEITDIDFPDNPTSVDWQDGFFIVSYDDGRFFISTDGLSWDSLEFASAESNPDRLLRVISLRGELVMLGDISAEFWGNSGNVDFTFSKIQGADQEWGLGARESVARLGGSIAFLCRNKEGQAMVGRLRGHDVDQISTPDMDTLINGFAVASDATALSFVYGGHPMYQINFPSGGYSFSYDLISNQWSTRKSYGITRHRCEYATQFLGKTILSDYSNGNLYRLNGSTYTENGASIEGEIIGDHLTNELAPFVLDLIRIDMETGVGAVSGEGDLPQIMLSMSEDGGRQFDDEQMRSFGAIGDYKEIPEWDRLGLFERATIKIRITDPVKRTILGCYVNPPR